MDFDEITRIVEMMRAHELTEFELERADFKLRIRKQGGGHWVAASPYPQHAPPAAAPAPATAAAPAAAGDEVELAMVKSPIVGTFYRASEPAAKPFADVGDVVKKGQVLCIIEAMKLMNEIQAEVRGKVVRIVATNGQPVEYGQTLFLVDES